MEYSKLCKIIPEEVWEMVLNRIDKSRDTYNIITALPNLLERFQNRKPQWLFAEVLPLISEYLGVNGVLKCRLVCKLWDLKIHNLLANHPYYQPYNEDPENDLPVNTVEVNQNCPLFKLATHKPVLRFRSPESMDQFLDLSSNSQFFRGPVFANTIWLQPRTFYFTYSPDDFERHSLHFLNNMGTYVQHLIITSSGYFETPADFYKRLCVYLKQTPNLKSLTLYLFCQSDAINLSSFLKTKPLPQLPLLQYVYLYSDICDHGDSIFSAVLLHYVGQQDSKVQKLKINISSMKLNSKISCFRQCFENLTEVEISADGNLDGLLENLSGSKIQKLVVHTKGYCNSPTILYNCLHGKFGQNIRILDLRQCNYQKMTIFSNLKMPKLHTLYLQNSYGVNYTFLPQISSLTKLEFAPYMNGDDIVPKAYLYLYEMRVVDFKDPVGHQILRWVYDDPFTLNIMYIWQLLPSLQQFRVPKYRHKNWLMQTYRRRSFKKTYEQAKKNS